ncbi:hypothetical protein U9M48_018357 [Paspalum notatum var. saurae]|uniref:Uncharacterized protein n=1 Tax=Paspalum notatum var. saurae TaxID=547442 RepID=A0AAQ3WQF9_PASNO
MLSTIIVHVSSTDVVSIPANRQEPGNGSDNKLSLLSLQLEDPSSFKIAAAERGPRNDISGQVLQLWPNIQLARTVRADGLHPSADQFLAACREGRQHELLIQRSRASEPLHIQPRHQSYRQYIRTLDDSTNLIYKQLGTLSFSSWNPGFRILLRLAHASPSLLARPSDKSLNSAVNLTFSKWPNLLDMTSLARPGSTTVTLGTGPNQDTLVLPCSRTLP